MKRIIGNSKKLWVTVLVLLLLATACSSEGGSTPDSTAGSATPGASQTAEPEARPTVRLFFSDHNSPLPTTPLNETEVVKFLAEQMNIDLDVVAIAHSGYREQLNLRMAGGDVPDVYQAWSLSDEVAVSSGRVMPLNDLLQEHGQNLLAVIPQSSWDAVTFNGEIMAIPTPPNAAAERVLFIRMDWLDELGLEIPETSDELLDVFRAFRDGDPNGNQIQDEIPFSMRENLSWGENIFGMFGINPDSETLHDGEIIPGIVHPNMKQALEFLRTLYSENLLDIEFLTNSSAIWTQKIQADLVGSWVHNTSLGTVWNGRLDESLPDKNTEVRAIPTPLGVGYEGPVGRVERPVGKTYLIMDSAQHPDAIVRMFDWLSTEEGGIFATFGLEGVTYTREGDQYIYDRDADEGLNFLWRGSAFRVTNSPLFERANRGEEGYQALVQEVELANNEGIPNVVASMPMPQAYLDNPELRNTGSLWLEAATLIILGDQPLDYFDQFVNEWYREGGAEAIAEMTEWYHANN